MMIDVREDILARLLVIGAAIPNIRSAQRNNVDIPEDQLPAVIIFDGDEETDDGSDLSQRPANRPTVVQMRPEIHVAGWGDEVTLDVPTMRRELIKRVLNDTELNDLIVKTARAGGGAIRYLGCQTDVVWLRKLHLALRAQFLIKYALKPWQL
jgi:hypothetical protein